MLLVWAPQLCVSTSTMFCCSAGCRHPIPCPPAEETLGQHSFISSTWRLWELITV